MSKKEQTANVELKFDPEKLSVLTTTSSRIRYLDACGMTRGEIAKTLNKRYQHVRNVLITPVKKGS